MQFSRFALVFLAVSSVLNLSAQEKPAAPKEPAKADAASGQSAKSSGPAVDDAKVTGTTFESPYFKFTYELPTGWKALDDGARKSSNQKAMQEDMEHARTVIAVPKKSAAKTAAKASTTTNPKPQAKPVVPERYSLLAASPDGLSSLASPVLPRINIWAHRKMPPLDKPLDQAELLMSGKHIEVLVRPQQLDINGHQFVRVELVNVAGKYQARYIMEIGDFLVGFDFLSESEREMAEYSNSIKSVKFE